MRQNDRGVEQLVARRAHNPKVAGSSPAPATKMKMPGLSGRFHLALYDEEKQINPSQRFELSKKNITHDNTIETVFHKAV